jgi:Spy/CpxP family protein refolding chaperone
MKLPPSILRVIVPAFLLALPCAVTAQPTETARPQGQRQPGAQAPGLNGFALGGPVGVLTDQQRVSYEAAMGKQRAKMLELQAQIRIARQDFVAASVDQKFDENVLRQKAMAAYRFEAEMAVLRAKAMSEVQPPLTAEQIEKIKTGQPGQVRPLRQQQQQLEHSAPHSSPASTNHDENGLPPKK